MKSLIGEREDPGTAQGRSDFTRRALVAGAVAIGVVLLLALLWYAARVVLLAFAAVLVGVLLHALGDWIRRHTPLSYSWALATVVLLILLAVGLAGWLFGTRLADQAAQLSERLPQAVEQARQRLQQTGWGQRLLQQMQGSQGTSQGGGGIAGALSGFFRTTLGGLVDFIVVLIVGLYLAAKPDLYTGGLVRLVPLRNRPRAREVLGALGTTLRRWLVGRFTVMALNGILTGIGLWLLGVPLPFMLGVLTGLLNFIPNIGPILAAVPAVLLALSVGSTTALYTALLFLVVQNLEGFVLTPLVQQRTVSLPPAVILMSQVLLGVLAGTLGVLVATPLAAVTLVLVRLLYVEDTLGDPVNVPGTDT